MHFSSFSCSCLSIIVNNLSGHLPLENPFLRHSTTHSKDLTFYSFSLPVKLIVCSLNCLCKQWPVCLAVVALVVINNESCLMKPVEQPYTVDCDSHKESTSEKQDQIADAHTSAIGPNGHSLLESSAKQCTSREEWHYSCSCKC